MEDSTLLFPSPTIPVAHVDAGAQIRGNSPRHGFLRRPFHLVHAIAVAAGLGLVVLGYLACAPEMARRSAVQAVAVHASNFVNDARFARSEAVRLNSPVVLCRVADADASFPRCVNSDEGGDWEEGWIVFRDSDGDNDRGPAEPLLRMQRPLLDSGGIKAEGAKGNRIRFEASGSAQGERTTIRFHAVGEQSITPALRTVCVDALGMASSYDRGNVVCG